MMSIEESDYPCNTEKRHTSHLFPVLQKFYVSVTCYCGERIDFYHTDYRVTCDKCERTYKVTISSLDLWEMED